MRKLDNRGFSLIETIVAAAVLSLAVIMVIAVVRKGQDQMVVDSHRRVARAIVDTTLEGTRFYPGNYGSIATGTTTDIVTLDTTAHLTATRSIVITSGTIAGPNVNYKQLQVKLKWDESGGISDSVQIARMVPDIPDSMQNIAPFAETITSSGPAAAGYPEWNTVDGIIGLNKTGDWMYDGSGTHILNPWIQLTWKNTHRIKKIMLYDRHYSSCHANQGTIYFNGSATPFTTITIPDCSSGTCNPGTAVFGPQEVQSITIQLNGSITGSFYFVGLSEIEVYE